MSESAGVVTSRILKSCSCFTNVDTTVWNSSGGSGPRVSKKSMKDGVNTDNIISHFSRGSLFPWRIKNLREKIKFTLYSLYSNIDSIPQPDDVQDYIRRRKRATEFISRFCRNYLYQFSRQILEIHQEIKRHSCDGDRHIYHAALCQKLINAYQIAHLALQAYLHHLPTSIVMGLPTKLREFLKLLQELSYLSNKLQIISADKQDGENEIEKRCNDLLTLVEIPDDGSVCKLSNKSSSVVKGFDRSDISTNNKGVVLRKLSMYTSKSHVENNNESVKKYSLSNKVKRKQTHVKNKYCVSCTSTLGRREIPRSDTPKLSFAVDLMKNSHDSCQDTLKKKTRKKYVDTPYNMDEVTTVIQKIPPEMNKENYTATANACPEKHKPCLLQKSEERCCLEARNIRLIILPPYEEDAEEKKGTSFINGTSTVQNSLSTESISNKHTWNTNDKYNTNQIFSLVAMNSSEKYRSDSVGRYFESEVHNFSQGVIPLKTPVKQEIIPVCLKTVFDTSQSFVSTKDTEKKEVKLKIPQLNEICFIEYKKSFSAYTSKKPIYRKSAKPWLILSRLADQLSSDILQEILSEFDFDVIIRQIYALELS